MSLFSTSYDRYWEGRKSFAQVTSNTRSLARLLWVNIALPPTDGDPAYTKGKTPQPDLTSFQLRRRKVEALQLCLFFVFATKHYLRGEDGMDHEDYQGIMPQSFVRSREISSASQSRYDVTKQSDGSSLAANAPGDSPSDTTSVYGHSQYGTNKIDATKRVRAKRSKPQFANQATPLMSGKPASNTDLHINTLEGSMPLPLMCVHLIAFRWVLHSELQCSISHELSRSLFRFKREGFLETVGPAGEPAFHLMNLALRLSGTNQMSQLLI